MTGVPRLMKCLALVVPLLLLASNAHATPVYLSMTTDPDFVPYYEVGTPWVPATVDVVIDIGVSSFATVKFYLSGTSSWDGKCMNYGNDNAATPDIKLWKGDQPTPAGLTWTQTDPAREIEGLIDGGDFVNGQTMKLKVRVRDSAAFSYLQGELYNSEYDPGMTAGATSGENFTDTSCSIPDDDANHNGIADAWEIDGVADRDVLPNGYDPVEDAEVGPAWNTNSGDDLSLFEEYRGFVIQGWFWRTDPKVEKDLFVNSSVMHGGAPLGYGDASMLPGVFNVHHVSTLEYKPNGRGINWRGIDVPGHILQKVLIASETTELHHSKYGETVPVPNITPTQWVPRGVWYIKIHTGLIRADTAPNGAWNVEDPLDIVQISQTLGHEIGHGISAGPSPSHCATSGNTLFRYCGMRWAPVWDFGAPGWADDKLDSKGYSDGAHNHSLEYLLTWTEPHRCGAFVTAESRRPPHIKPQEHAWHRNTAGSS